MIKKLFLLLALLSGTAISAEAEIKTFDVVGTDVPPLMYQENGNPAGFYVDILQAMLTEMKNIKTAIRFYPAPRMFKILSKNKNTFSLGITRNEKREKQFKWVGPIYPRIFALFKLKKRSDLHVETLKDIRPYRIGVGRGYASVNDLLNAGVPRENIHEVNTDRQNIRKLFAERIDFVVGNDVMLAYLLKLEGHRWGAVKQVLILNEQYQFWFAFNRDVDDKYIERFQHALDRLKQNGRYEDIVKKYFR